MIFNDCAFLSIMQNPIMIFYLMKNNIMPFYDIYPEVSRPRQKKFCEVNL